MKRIFTVTLSNHFDSSTSRWRYEVVAANASAAIAKAVGQAKREGRGGGWQVEKLKHRGAAV